MTCVWDILRVSTSNCWVSDSTHWQNIMKTVHCDKTHTHWNALHHSTTEMSKPEMWREGLSRSHVAEKHGQCNDDNRCTDAAHRDVKDDAWTHCHIIVVICQTHNTSSAVAMSHTENKRPQTFTGMQIFRQIHRLWISTLIASGNRPKCPRTDRIFWFSTPSNYLLCSK